MTEHFSTEELMCKCGCLQAAMDPGFMSRLEALRLAFNRPMPITSGYRCQAHNSAVGGRPTSPHVIGLAVDVAVSGEEAYWLVLFAMQLGFTGIGVSQGGSRRGLFVHIDDLPVAGHPRPRLWSY